MSISKKTLYKHFKNKAKLIESVIDVFHTRIRELVESNHCSDMSAIEESFYIKDKISELLKTNDHNSIFELQKYYPELHIRHNFECYNLIYNHFSYIIPKGQKAGFFYDDVNIEHVSKFYFAYLFQMYNEHSFDKFKEIAPKNR